MSGWILRVGSSTPGGAVFGGVSLVLAVLVAIWATGHVRIFANCNK